MFTTIFTFILTSLYPTKRVLRLRLAPLHAYMGATILFTVLITFVDYLILQPDFFLPMWLFLHGFAVFFFYLIWVAVNALYVQMFTRLKTKQTWAYRQAWPYAVSMTLVPTLLLVIVYHLISGMIWVPFVFLLVYMTYPLTKIPPKKHRVTNP